MAASLTVAALLLLPWLHAWGALDRSDLSEDISMKRTIVRLKRRARVGSTLDVNGALGLNGTLWRHARRARVGSPLDLNSSLHLGCNKQWRTVNKIGEGSFGYIYEVTSDEGVVGVLKKLKLEEGVQEGDEEWDDAVEEFEKEKEVMKDMKDRECPNTVQLSDTDPCVDGTTSAPFQFVMPKYKTDLHNYMHRYRNIENKDTSYGRCFKTIFGAVVKGVDCMNKAGWVHMDIKPQNVFITYPDEEFDCQKVEVAVADYGLAYRDQAPQQTYSGNPIYHPPETFGQSRRLGLKWKDAHHFVTDRTIDRCMLRILFDWMNRVAGGRMLPKNKNSFESEFRTILDMHPDECKYRR